VVRVRSPARLLHSKLLSANTEPHSQASWQVSLSAARIFTVSPQPDLRLLVLLLERIRLRLSITSARLDPLSLALLWAVSRLAMLTHGLPGWMVLTVLLSAPVTSLEWTHTLTSRTQCPIALRTTPSYSKARMMLRLPLPRARTSGSPRLASPSAVQHPALPSLAWPTQRHTGMRLAVACSLAKLIPIGSLFRMLTRQRQIPASEL